MIQLPPNITPAQLKAIIAKRKEKKAQMALANMTGTGSTDTEPVTEPDVDVDAIIMASDQQMRQLPEDQLLTYIDKLTDALEIQTDNKVSVDRNTLIAGGVVVVGVIVLMKILK